MLTLDDTSVNTREFLIILAAVFVVTSDDAATIMCNGETWDGLHHSHGDVAKCVHFPVMIIVLLVAGEYILLQYWDISNHVIAAD